MAICGKCGGKFTGTSCPFCAPKKTTAPKRKLSSEFPSASSSSAAASSSSLPPQQVRKQRVLAPGYALLHTLGRCKLDAHGGDGAYANWMQRYFEAVIAGGQTNCKYVDRLVYQGAVGNANTAQLSRETNPQIRSEFERVLDSPELKTIDIVILNWHIRYTGTPNGYTGRGLNQALINSLHKMAAEAEKRLVIVYTVHENSSVKRISKTSEQPSGLITLNPAVHGHMQEEFPADDVQGLQSQVPGLMTSLHTTVLSRIFHYLGYLDPPTLPGIVRPTNPLPVPRLTDDPKTKQCLAILMQELRLRLNLSRQTVGAVAPGEAGIVLFGMISARHGTTRSNVQALCAALTLAAIPDTFRVIIAGKEEEADLVSDLRDLATTTPRLRVIGLLKSFDELAHCKYALSFDTHGFRTNASAMINVMRAGHLLFSRNGGESDDQLIQRTVNFIRQAGPRAQPVSYMISQQMPRCLDSDEQIVGRRLGQFFDSIAAKDSANFVDTSLDKMLGEPEEDEQMASAGAVGMILNFQANSFPLHTRPDIRLRVQHWTEPDGDCGIYALGILANRPFTRPSLAQHLRTLGGAQANQLADSFTGLFQTRWLGLQQMYGIGHLLGLADIALVGFNPLQNTWSSLHGDPTTSLHIVAHVPAALGSQNNHWVVMSRL
ncbi:hypothetical protein [Rugamonas aquatica]|uniref:Uncharacterized protein n=1 Tax=Rugamonas aquatica TaxID=2743357 RepID=A0A6A7NB65_9BURK|nr:hypothetical protein [Rugamonas aquatica]MQA41757.1 hypothetical protein [Rugamonas aquatica]